MDNFVPIYHVMKKRFSTKYIKAGAASCAVMGISISALAFHYTVQKGDTLSKIAATHFPGRVYGKSGGLEKMIFLNPNIKNLDLVYAGQLLKTDEADPKIFAKAEILEQDEVMAKALEKRSPASDSEQSENSQTGFIPYSTISFLPKLKYQRISGTDNTNSASSKLYSIESVGIDFDWLLHWSENLASVVGLRYSNYKYQEISNRTLVDDSVSTAAISLGVQYKTSERTLIYSNLEFGSHVYLYAPTATSLRVDKGNALSNKTGIKHTLADLRPVKFDIFGGVNLIAPTDVDTYRSKFGYSGHLGIELSHTLKSGNRIKSVFEIDHGPRNTNPVDQNHDNMSLGIGLEWRLE